MKKTLLTLAALAVSLIGGQALTAGYGVIPQRSTFRNLVNQETVVVKAKLLEVVETPFVASEAVPSNMDVALYRYNNSDEAIRRDAKLEITSVLQGDAQLGTMTIVSPMQMAMDKFPASVKEGGEAIFYLKQHTGSDNLWRVQGERRGIIATEDVGSLTAAANAISDVIEINKTSTSTMERNGRLQDRLLSEVSVVDSRLAEDALLEFGWNYAEFVGFFTDAEKAQMLEHLSESIPGSEMRRHLLFAIGRLTPEGGDTMIADIIASDENVRIATVGSWALEQYGRVNAAGKLLDRYTAMDESKAVNRARLITALGVLRPKATTWQETDMRVRFMDVLRGALSTSEHAEVRQEALLAARDMRFVNNELRSELRGIIQAFGNNAASEEDFKRAIVALAATRTVEARTYLEELKSSHQGRYEKHIQMAVVSPFTVLVDGK